MAKQIVKSGRQSIEPLQQVDISAGARVVISALTGAEKVAVADALRSAPAILSLPVQAVVSSEHGDLYTARVTPQLRLIYRRERGRVVVTDLLSAGAVRNLVHPAWVVSKHPRTGVKSRSRNGKGGNGSTASPRT